jgi:hypothetical protein
VCVLTAVAALDSHFHFDYWMGIIANNFEIVERKLFDIITFGFDVQLRKFSWLSKQLLFQCFDMIQVNMCIANDMDKFTCIQAGHMGNHMGEQRVRCNIEWYAKTDIARPLIKQARKLIASHIKPLTRPSNQQNSEKESLLRMHYWTKQ